MLLSQWHENKIDLKSGVYKFHYSPPPGGGTKFNPKNLGKEIQGKKEEKGRKKEKKREGKKREWKKEEKKRKEKKWGKERERGKEKGKNWWVNSFEIRWCFFW